jgi:hypothetical protein
VLIAAEEATADDALLDPRRARRQGAFGREAGELGARPGAARRTIVSAAGAQNEVAAVGATGRPADEKLNMINFAAVFTAMHGASQFGPDGKRGFGQPGDVGAFDRARRSVDQEEPIAAPGDIARDDAETLDGDFQAPPMDVARHVLDGGFVAAVKLDRDDSDRRLETVNACPDATHVRESHCSADGAVTAHAEKAGVVEEDEPCGAAWVDRLAKQRADHGVESAWFVERKGASVVVLLRK